MLEFSSLRFSAPMFVEVVKVEVSAAEVVKKVTATRIPPAAQERVLLFGMQAPYPP